MAKCGECLMRDVEIVELDPSGKCPKCGADYGRQEEPEPEKKRPDPQFNREIQ